MCPVAVQNVHTAKGWARLCWGSSALGDVDLQQAGCLKVLSKNHGCTGNNDSGAHHWRTWAKTILLIPLPDAAEPPQAGARAPSHCRYAEAAAVSGKTGRRGRRFPEDTASSRQTQDKPSHMQQPLNRQACRTGHAGQAQGRSMLGGPAGESLFSSTCSRQHRV